MFLKRRIVTIVSPDLFQDRNLYADELNSCIVLSVN